MRVRLRHEWLQKHPSPRSAGGDFHWFPSEVDADLRALLAEGARAGGQALWRLDARRVAWAVSFAEIAPADRRRYVGLAVTVAEPVGAAATAAELLAAVPVLPAAPWRDQPAAAEVEIAPPAAHAAAPSPAPVDPSSAAQALWQGGALIAADPTAPSVPAALATLESWLPAAVRARPRAGTVLAAKTPDAPPPAPLHHYLGLAWALPPAIAARDADYGRRAWQLALGAAARAGATAEALFDELAALARAWDTAADLDAYLARTGTVRADERAACDRRAPAPLAAATDAGWLWSRVVHYWGRGLLAGDGLDERLAALLARRVVADHLFHLDAPEQAALPERYLRRLRWESLLPEARAAQLAARVEAHLEAFGG